MLGPRGLGSLTLRAAVLAGPVLAGTVLAGTVLAGTVGIALSAVPAQAAPSDEIRSSQQWVLDMLDVPAAWQVSQGAGVTVAVIDSGVSPSASDLAGSVTTGPDLTGLKTSPSNSAWGVHGTWMASIIAGHGHDAAGSGITGVAPQARLLSIRAIPDKSDPGFHAYDSEKEQVIQQSLATGIMDAARDGAKVISMSIGYSAPSSAVRAAVQYAESRGVVLVASSGNSGQDDQPRSSRMAPVSFPAEYPGVLSVGAVNADGAVAGFSSNNLSVQVAAPGVDVPAQGRDGAYWLVSGTSPACALVAGVVALIKSRYPALSPPLVDQALTSTARSSTSYNAKTGFGTVDANAALQEAGKLATQRPGTSPEAASARFGGGPGAVPAPPVQPRGAGQLVLFILLGLVGLAIVTGGGLLGLALVARSRRRQQAGQAAAAPPGSPGPPGYSAPAGYRGPGRYGPAAGHGAPGGYPGAGRPSRPDGPALRRYPDTDRYPDTGRDPGTGRYPDTQRYLARPPSAPRRDGPYR